MKANETACAFCQNTIDTTDDRTYQQTMGWVRHRKQGGGNAIALPERLWKWACDDCIRIRSAGLLNQPTLFE